MMYRMSDSQKSLLVRILDAGSRGFFGEVSDYGDLRELFAGAFIQMERGRYFATMKGLQIAAQVKAQSGSD